MIFNNFSLKIKTLLGWNKSWKDIEYFNEDWKNRIQQMAMYLSETESVIDLGCGQMWLKNYISPQNKYYGVDYIPRNEDTIVCDFNASEYPEFKVDTAFVSGCFEYVEDYRRFVSQIARYSKRCILSYCTLDNFPDYTQRNKSCWKNHLKEKDLIQLFIQTGFKLVEKNVTPTNNSVFVFEKKENDKSALCEYEIKTIIID